MQWKKKRKTNSETKKSMHTFFLKSSWFKFILHVTRNICLKKTWNKNAYQSERSFELFSKGTSDCCVQENYTNLEIPSFLKNKFFYSRDRTFFSLTMLCFGFWLCVIKRARMFINNIAFYVQCLFEERWCVEMFLTLIFNPVIF